MDIIDYQIMSLQNIIPYLRQNEDIKTILQSVGSRFTNLQSATGYLETSYSIQDARGVWLDYAGAEVGAQRDEMDFGNYFCVNRKHINTEKRFYFLTSGQNPESPLSLEDAEYIQKIYAYIGANLSCGTRAENINIIKTITNADKVFVTYTAPCSLKVHLSGKSLVLTQNTITYIQQLLGDGVFLEEIVY